MKFIHEKMTFIHMKAFIMDTFIHVGGLKYIKLQATSLKLQAQVLHSFTYIFVYYM
jgi:hypothetical protein